MSDTQGPPRPGSGGRSTPWARSLPVLMGALVALHAALLLYDVRHPEAFLTGDRAIERMWNAWLLLCSVGSPVAVRQFLVSHGIFGDYVYHALLFALGGTLGVIVVQVALHLASVACLFRLTKLLTRVAWAPLVAALSYALLPNSVVYHEAVTEALAVPLLALSLYGLAVYLIQGRRLSRLVASGLALGVAITIRPQLALWPVGVAVLLLATDARRRALAPAALFLLLALAPLGAWGTYMWAETGRFSLGEARTHDLGHNLYLRARYITDVMPAAEREAVRRQYLRPVEDGSLVLSLAQYASLVRHHPVAYLKYYGQDLLVFVGKPEVTRIFVDYCPRLVHARADLLVELSDELRKRGVLAALRLLGRQNRLFVLGWLGGTVALFLYWAGAGVGLWACWSKRRSPGWADRGPACWMLAALVPYCALVGQAAAHISGRYRAPAEFALSLFFALGVAHLAERRPRPWPAGTPIGGNAGKAATAHR